MNIIIFTLLFIAIISRIYINLTFHKFIPRVDSLERSNRAIKLYIGSLIALCISLFFMIFSKL